MRHAGPSERDLRRKRPGGSSGSHSKRSRRAQILDHFFRRMDLCLQVLAVPAKCQPQKLPLIAADPPVGKEAGPLLSSHNRRRANHRLCRADAFRQDLSRVSRMRDLGQCGRGGRRRAHARRDHWPHLWVLENCRRSELDARGSRHRLLFSEDGRRSAFLLPLAQAPRRLDFLLLPLEAVLRQCGPYRWSSPPGAGRRLRRGGCQARHQACRAGHRPGPDDLRGSPLRWKLLGARGAEAPEA